MKVPKPSDYPKKLSLRGETYRVLFIKNLKSIGETDPEKKTIKIRSGMSDNETLRTMIHEVIHLIEFEWPIKIKHKHVYKWEKAWFQFLLDNFFGEQDGR